MTRLGEPEEGQDHHDETIGDVITLLNHAVNELLDNKNDDHEEGENQVNHTFRLQVFRSGDSLQPGDSLLLVFHRLKEGD